MKRLRVFCCLMFFEDECPLIGRTLLSSAIPSPPAYETKTMSGVHPPPCARLACFVDELDVTLPLYSAISLSCGEDGVSGFSFWAFPSAERPSVVTFPLPFL